jgi:hypothetical protein
MIDFRAVVASAAFAGVRSAAAVTYIPSGEGEGDAKLTVRFLRGVLCGVVDGDDDDDDDDDDGDGDDEGNVAAPFVPADSFPDDDGDGDDEGNVAAPFVLADSFPFLYMVKLDMSNVVRKPEPLSGLMPFSSVASGTPWRARWKAEEVSGLCLRPFLVVKCNLSSKRDLSSTFDVHFSSQREKQ